MLLSVNKAKIANPLLSLYADNEIEEVVLYLERIGFVWSDSKRAFYCEKTDKVIGLKKVISFIEDREELRKEIEINNEQIINKRKECLEDIRVADFFTNFLIFFIIINLFLGHLIFSNIAWIGIEIILIFLFWLFLRAKKTIEKKINKQKYVS
jgi:hypothetical protein